MKYELAKKLKDAGFPQKEISHIGQHWIASDGDIQVHQGSDDTECLIPTLEELIGACGERFSILMYFPDDEKIWRVRECKGLGRFFDAKTPSEAIANLWLELKR